MSSAKAALENDARVLAFEAGRAWGHRVNVISAGRTVARGKRIGFIDQMLDYTKRNSPLTDAITAASRRDRGVPVQPAASGITGSVVYVDKGYQAMASRRPREP